MPARVAVVARALAGVRVKYMAENTCRQMSEQPYVTYLVE